MFVGRRVLVCLGRVGLVFVVSANSVIWTIQRNTTQQHKDNINAIVLSLVAAVVVYSFSFFFGSRPHRTITLWLPYLAPATCKHG